MSWVFLTDRHAWKLKKPVKHAFLDFSTIDLRREDCEREVRLNRRLAPEVYLGVVPLTLGRDASLRLDGEGGPVDWLVKMKRLPAEGMLDNLLEGGAATPEQALRLAAVLSAFYGRTPPVGIAAEDYRRRFERTLTADRDELLRHDFGLPPEQVARATDGLLATLQDAPELFDSRIADGRVIEAHGDLRPQHVCMIGPRPVVIDCLEFNRDLRVLDPLEELAYFTLECERLGARWFGDLVRRRDQDTRGDHPPDRLFDFYIRGRALVRAKLAVWHTADNTVDHHDQWRERAQWYLDYATA